MTRKILLLITIFSSQALSQEITKEHWTRCFQITKDEQKFSGSTTNSLSGRHEFTIVARFKGEKDGWHRIAYGVSGGLRDGEQWFTLSKLKKDGLWVKKQEDEEAQIAFPFPLKVGQKWAHSDGRTISLRGIQDFEAVDRTYEDCLVFELEGEKTKGELWYAPEIGLLFSKQKESAFLVTMRKMPKKEKALVLESKE